MFNAADRGTQLVGYARTSEIVLQPADHAAVQWRSVRCLGKHRQHSLLIGKEFSKAAKHDVLHDRGRQPYWPVSVGSPLNVVAVPPLSMVPVGMIEREASLRNEQAANRRIAPDRPSEVFC